MLARLKALTRGIEQDLRLYQLVLRDPRTPRLAKISLWLALGYLALPFDLIPDVLPVIGHLDDVLIVGGLVYLAFRLVPQSVIEAHRATVAGSSAS